MNAESCPQALLTSYLELQCNCNWHTKGQKTCSCSSALTVELLIHALQKHINASVFSKGDWNLPSIPPFIGSSHMTLFSSLLKGAVMAQLCLWSCHHFFYSSSIELIQFQGLLWESFCSQELNNSCI